MNERKKSRAGCAAERFNSLKRLILAGKISAWNGYRTDEIAAQRARKKSLRADPSLALKLTDKGMPIAKTLDFSTCAPKFTEEVLVYLICLFRPQSELEGFTHIEQFLSIN
jgi:hypothetical protein